MRPQFTEHKVLAAADLEDERRYLDEAHDRHLALLHGASGDALLAARVVHPNEQAAIGLGDRPGDNALTVTATGAAGQSTEQARVTGPPPSQVTSGVVFARPASAAAAGPAPGTLSLLAGVGHPAATELRIEAPGRAGAGRIMEVRYRSNPIRRPLSIAADGTVTVIDLEIGGTLALGPPPSPAGAPTPDPTGSVAAAEALRQQLNQGLGIGEDKGIAIAIVNPAVGGGRVRFTVEVTDVQGVAPLTISIRGRVNVGTAVVAEDLGLLSAQLQVGQALRRAVDVAIPAAAKGDVIVAATAFGVDPQVGLVNASEARMIGTVV